MYRASFQQHTAVASSLPSIIIPYPVLGLQDPPCQALSASRGLYYGLACCRADVLQSNKSRGFLFPALKALELELYRYSQHGPLQFARQFVKSHLRVQPHIRCLGNALREKFVAQVCVSLSDTMENRRDKQQRYYWRVICDKLRQMRVVLINCLWVWMGGRIACNKACFFIICFLYFYNIIRAGCALVMVIQQ